jgi:hypothetical protein
MMAVKGEKLVARQYGTAVFLKPIAGVSMRARKRSWLTESTPDLK